MASESVAASTLDSVDLEALQKQRQILQKYAQPQEELNQDTNDADAGVIRESQQEDSTTKDSGENENSNERGSTVQESVQQLTPKSSPSQRKKAVFLPPPLPTSKSMPTVEMDGTRSAAIGRRLEQSFAGFPHEHGDTQQWPSQDVINASLQGETATPQRSYAGGETQLTNRTPYTLQSGDAGHINFDDYKGSSPSHDAEFLQDETQGPSQVQRTPAPLTRQLSDLLTSGATAKTPGFTQAFGFEKNTTMTGTQMFAQTQQPSSDLPLPHYSDAIDDRPEFEQPPSSPPPTLSSTPAMLRRPASAGGEPRSEVLTREAERKIKAEAKARELARLQQLADNFDDDELSEDTQLRNARARREKAAQWSDNDAWDRINAPARTGSRPSSARKARSNEPIDLRTPGTVRKNYDKLIEAPMQDEETDDDEELPEEPAEDIQHSEHDEPDADMGDDEQLPGENEDNEPDNGSVNDEYDELSGVIRASQANLEDHIEFGSVNGSVAHEDDMEMQDNEPEPDEQGSTKAGQDGVPHQHVPESTNRSTVADSQPMPDHLAPVQHPVPSSNVSRVPGSQYKAQEGQEMAAPTDENGGQAGASLQNGSIGEEEKIPSSPPLQNADNTIPDNSAEASLLMQKMLDQFQARTESTEDGSTVQPEIPESDLPEAVRSRPHTAEAAEQNESLQAPFSTARTHVSASAQSPNKASAAPSPIKPAQSQQSRSTDETPRKRAGVLHFSEMAKGQLKTNPSFESQNIIDDIDDVMNGVYTDGDKSFQQHMSSPERPRAKRPKLAHTSSSLSSSSLARPPPFRQEQSAADDGNQQPVNVAAKEVVRDEQTSFARPLKPEPVSDEQEQDGMDVDVAQPDEASAEIAESEIAAQSPPAALRESPSKANKLPTPTINSSPKDKNRQDTSDSVREREKAGRAAVSQLVSARSTASAKRAKPTTYGRPSRRKSSTATSKAKARARSTRQATPEDSEHGDEVETDSQPAEMAVDQTSADLLLQAEEDEADELAGGDADKVAAPERVFALFKGTPQNFYPATYLGGSADGMTYKIKFDDGTSTNIDTQHVRSLELRVGDIVKVDDPEMRRKNWRIAGFGGVARSQNDTELGTDVYGHTRLKVQVSHNRTSMAGPSSTPADDGEVKEILVNTIYITPTMWPQYKDRAFSPSSTSKSIGKRAETPSTRSHTPAVETPASRSRRAPAPGGKAKVSGSRPSHLRETSVAPSSSAGNSSGIFSHMAFAISFVQDSAEKAEVTQAIRGHGGTVLDVGFEELFELPSLDGAATTSPSKKSPRKQATEAGGLQLKERYKNIRFAACISDKHSRRAKYIQALALGLPTISGRWIIHCLDETRNSSLSNGEVTPISWDKYLLPAGESIFLGGSIRSRTLTPYAASTSDLTTTISSRANLLSGEGLLIVAPRKGGNKEEEKRKTFAFLTLALGAGQVKRVADFGAAKKLVADNEGVWKWIYADGSIFEDAKAEIFGGSGNGKTAGKKRKRSDDEDSSKMFATDGKVKLVNDEFVIQSLILGALVEE